MEMTTEKIKIISAGAITAMLRRIAYEIYERNFACGKLALAGIGPRGAYLADILQAHLAEISNLELMRADFAKADEGLAWKDGHAPDGLAGCTLLIVDDVLYSGSTVLQALVMVSELGTDKIQTAVLIDRGHHRFPVQGNYVGMEIATSLKQYVSVEIDTENQRAEAFIF